jgi:uncharacterized membrane protein YoaK (UPF0700 family)
VNEGCVAVYVIGMLLAVAALVIGAGSLDFLLQRICTAEVIRMSSPPLLISLVLLLAAAVRTATGFLPLLEPRMRMKPTTTERTPPLWEHVFLHHRES